MFLHLLGVYCVCLVSMNHKITMSDLIEVDMVDFDVILGIDCLHACYASIDPKLELSCFRLLMSHS